MLSHVYCLFARLINLYLLINGIRNAKLSDPSFIIGMKAWSAHVEI